MSIGSSSNRQRTHALRYVSADVNRGGSRPGVRTIGGGPQNVATTFWTRRYADAPPHIRANPELMEAALREDFSNLAHAPLGPMREELFFIILSEQTYRAVPPASTLLPGERAVVASDLHYMRLALADEQTRWGYISEVAPALHADPVIADILIDSEVVPVGYDNARNGDIEQFRRFDRENYERLSPALKLSPHINATLLLAGDSFGQLSWNEIAVRTASAENWRKWCRHSDDAVRALPKALHNLAFLSDVLALCGLRLQSCATVYRNTGGKIDTLVTAAIHKGMPLRELEEGSQGYPPSDRRRWTLLAAECSDRLDSREQDPSRLAQLRQIAGPRLRFEPGVHAGKSLLSGHDPETTKELLYKHPVRNFAADDLRWMTTSDVCDYLRSRAANIEILLKHDPTSIDFHRCFVEYFCHVPIDRTTSDLISRFYRVADLTPSIYASPTLGITVAERFAFCEPILYQFTRANPTHYELLAHALARYPELAKDLAIPDRYVADLVAINYHVAGYLPDSQKASAAAAHPLAVEAMPINATTIALANRPAIQAPYEATLAELETLGITRWDSVVNARVLRAVIDNRHNPTANNTKPLALVTYPVHDPSGAYDYRYDWIHKLADGYNLLYYETKNESEVITSYNEALAAYSTPHANRKNMLWVIGGHGQPTELRLSAGDGESAVLDVKDTDDMCAGFEYPLPANATIMLDACNTGRGGEGADNLANSLREPFPSQTIWSAKEQTLTRPRFSPSGLVVDPGFTAELYQPARRAGPAITGSAGKNR